MKGIVSMQFSLGHVTEIREYGPKKGIMHHESGRCLDNFYLKQGFIIEI